MSVPLKRPYEQAFLDQENNEDLKRRRTTDNWGG